MCLVCLCTRARGRVFCVSTVSTVSRFQGRPDATDALTINPGADVSDPRKKQSGAAAPTPSSARYPPRDSAPSDLVPGPATSHQDEGMDMGMENNYAQVNWEVASAGHIKSCE